MIDEFDYYLPKELIAQFPADARGKSRMMIVNRKDGRISGADFGKISEFFHAGDVIVLNDAKVRPARLIGTAGLSSVDILLVERVGKNDYHVKAKPSAKLKPGTKISFSAGRLKAVCINPAEGQTGGFKRIRFLGEEDIEEKLEDIGLMPLPPYIKRLPREQDKDRYQTVYARNPGAIAAPTAGLHFTAQTFQELRRKNAEVVFLTLNVGLGTFLPVREADFRRHRMHAEKYYLPEQCAGKIAQAKSAGKIICAVGTTSCRVLESCAEEGSGGVKITPGKGTTDLFIYPGYRFKTVDMLLTNFHLPRTTLLMLVCAFAGKELIMKAYKEAITRRYRFYSYGDCMLVV